MSPQTKNQEEWGRENELTDLLDHLFQSTNLVIIHVIKLELPDCSEVVLHFVEIKYVEVEFEAS